MTCASATANMEKAVLLTAIVIWLAAPGLHAEELQKRPIEFIHESYGNPQFASLQKEFDFDEYVMQGSGELDQMLLLKNWVFNNVEFRHNYAIGNLRNALKILRLAKTGSTFHCSHFAAVYLQCALSMGWTARYFFLRNIKGEEHAVNEVWSNELGKWIFIDVTWNIHIEKDGVPLSIIEIRKEWIRNGGKDVVYVFGAEENRQRYTYRDFPVERSDNNAWIWWPLDEIFITYTYEISLIGRNDFFNSSVGEGEAFWNIIYIVKDWLNSWDETWSLRRRTDVDDMRALYHDLNRVDIYHSEVNDRTLSIRLDAFGNYNYTPNFKEFLIKENNGEWKVSADRFLWNLNRRRNILQARVRNRFGVLGPIATLNVESD
jgi:hypothetical protein